MSSFELLVVASIWAISVSIWWDRHVSRSIPGTPTVILPNPREAKDEPQILVSYRPRDFAKNMRFETLVLVNEGPGAIQNVKIGPVQWMVQREIKVFGIIEPVREGHDISIQFGAYEVDRIGNSAGEPLTEILRSTHHETETRVMISFENVRREQFVRTFALTVDSMNKILWQPLPTSDTFSN